MALETTPVWGSWLNRCTSATACSVERPKTPSAPLLRTNPWPSSAVCSCRTAAPWSPSFSPTIAVAAGEPVAGEEVLVVGVVVAVGADGAPAPSPRNRAVFSVTTPVGLSPLLAWKLRRTRSVRGPNTPSTGRT